MNLVWTAMIVLGVGFAAFQGEAGGKAITNALLSSAEEAVTFTFALIGILAFWSGIMKLAEAAGWTRAIARVLAPLVRWLFPTVPKDHPAAASIVMALCANILGLGNAATPLGLKAMEDLKDLNGDSRVASKAMCTFLALSTSSLTVIPGTVIAVRAATGSFNPAAIVPTTLVATLASTAIAIACDKFFQARSDRQR